MTPAQRLHQTADDLALRGEVEAARSVRADATAAEGHPDEPEPTTPPASGLLHIVMNGRIWSPHETARFLVREGGRSLLDAALVTGLTTMQVRHSLRPPPLPGTVGPVRPGTDPFIIS
ncbi:MAG: hypothetical protein CMM85_20605 [Rhodothermaceae bacterium]|nr:hypothetical protein [Rhodothermaceae bacterium]